MKAPEKIYIQPNAHDGWFETNNLNESLTEYTRTDAFIEKACEYVREHVEYYMKKDKMCNAPLCPLFATKSFIENFKNYMKGE